MSEIKNTVNGQLQQLQMLMHRTMFYHYGKAYNPHRGQGRVLAILKMKPAISQKELTHLLNMSKQSVAELLAKLEKGGYIIRKQSEDDKRVMTIQLTEKGEKAVGDTEDSGMDALKVLDCLNEEELSAFSDYLERIIKQYEKQFPDEDFEQRRKYMEKFMSSYGHGFGHFKKGHGGHGGYGFYGGYGNQSSQEGFGGYGGYGNQSGQEGFGGYGDHGNQSGQEGFGGYGGHGNQSGQEGFGRYGDHGNQSGQEGFGRYGDHGNQSGQEGFGGYGGHG
ncbi:MarR family winged helix-turn-helix transcriptional regulator, partial [Lacrimispora sp.]|uniref:MarR family winged helix-turn-helix transcriptional regulator n=1 Tax=Lacrimispora sp. TaxID=2719234 RepID=UPI003996B475